MSHPADDASSVSGDAHGALRPLPTAESDTARLAERARRDIAAPAHPAAAWVGRHCTHRGNMSSTS
jgi:hypothetical protein